MLIDWFTVGAQVVNFLILVYLLKRFLYGPIIKAMDEREQKIASRLAQAQAQREAAEEERVAYREKSNALDAQRDGLLSEMKEDVEKSRKVMMAEIRTQVEGVRANWEKALEQEKDLFLQDLRSRASRHTYAVARRTLKDLADLELETHILRIFERRLNQLEGTEGEKLKEALVGLKGKAFLRSAFPIPQDAVQSIRVVLEALKGGPVEVALEEKPEVICGIELTVQGHKIAWSIAEYLQSLEAVVSQAFENGQMVETTATVNEEELEAKKGITA